MTGYDEDCQDSDVWDGCDYFVEKRPDKCAWDEGCGGGFDPIANGVCQDGGKDASAVGAPDDEDFLCEIGEDCTDCGDDHEYYY